MASNRPAQNPSYAPAGTEVVDFDHRSEEGTWEEWNPTAESVRPVRGRHRVARQRGGGLARSSTVLGVGVIAAVGAGGMATAQTAKPPVSISLPDLSSVTESAKALVGDDSGHDSGDHADTTAQTASAPLTGAGLTGADTAAGTTDAGEALRARIMRQAEAQQDQVDSATAKAAEAAAAKQAASAAEEAEAKAEKKAADAKEKAEAEAKKKAAAKKLAELAKQFTLPTSSYTITSTFGEAGSMWSSGYHTGLDFAAPTGTLIKAIHSGTITEAGWAGSYGYRTILTLDDGTELWFCHQSSISVSVGQKVSTGEVIGRVGATGNVTGPHLHLEVHPGGAATGIDPMAWLHGKGLNT